MNLLLYEKCLDNFISIKYFFRMIKFYQINLCFKENFKCQFFSMNIFHKKLLILFFLFLNMTYLFLWQNVEESQILTDSFTLIYFILWEIVYLLNLYSYHRATVAAKFQTGFCTSCLYYAQFLSFFISFILFRLINEREASRMV